MIIQKIKNNTGIGEKKSALYQVEGPGALMDLNHRGFMQNIIENYATFFKFQIMQNCCKICQDYANSPKILTNYANFA